MDRESIIMERKSISAFLSNISFNESYYKFYNEIITQMQNIDYNVIILLVCQTACQVEFDGYFDELYIDISKRKDVYIQQIFYNLRTAYMSHETCSSKFYKYICCLEMSNREKSFVNIIKEINFNSIFEIFIEDNEENEKFKQCFIAICNQILTQHQPTTNKRIVPVDY